ncbi:MAG TPA: hypothetical protein VF116_14490 [Ktedonobacterales bacterium]
MTPTGVSIPRLFEFLGVLGKTIRTIAGQSKEVKVSGRGRVTIVVDLGPHLEGVIRDLLAREGEREGAQAYWYRATSELISHDEEKFRTLSQLAVHDTTIGTEAIMQRADAVPEAMARVAVRYVEQYVLTPSADGTSSWQLPAPSLADTLQTAIREASEESAFSLTDRLGTPHVKPLFTHDKDSQ